MFVMNTLIIYILQPCYLCYNTKIKSFFKFSLHQMTNLKFFCEHEQSRFKIKAYNFGYNHIVWLLHFSSMEDQC
jgi:hypothetical protein